MVRKLLKKILERVPRDDAMAVAAPVAAVIGGGKPGADVEPEYRAPAQKLSLLQRIDFNYQDSPANHGWEIKGSPSFSLQPGGVLDIPTTGRYSMHYSVEPSACVGTLVEFVAKYEARNTAVYARVAVQNEDGSEYDEVWIKIQIGSHPPEQGRGTHEWIWYVQPTRLDGGWSKFEVDLPEAVEETFGNQGWSYRELIGFRLRGRLKIKQILVYS